MRKLIVVAVAVLSIATFGQPASAADELAAECAVVDGAVALTVGSVDCLRLPSTNLGGLVPVSYYIPPACAGGPCPVLYYLHGTGGSYREGTGAKGQANAWVKALTSGPPTDPRSVQDPWRFSDTSTWVPQPALDMIIVSPHGRTLPGGYGPAAGADTGWFDWNPRYAEGGDQQSYDTPAPSPHTFLVDELVPFVDAHFPTAGDREYRAILGYSQGGFGSYINGLTRPDIWSSLGMRSGGGLPLLAAGDVADVDAPAGAQPPAPVPHVRLPGTVPTLLPPEAHQQMLVSEATVGWGDPVADQAWMRASNPVDLIANARARGADGTQSVHLKHFVNDAVPRVAPDPTALNYMAQVYETLLYPMNLYMERVFDRHGVERTFDVGPGDHSGFYGVPYFREQLAEQYANLEHADGSGAPRPRPATFDYRSVRSAFQIWGWDVAVERAATEFLQLTAVTCEGLTLRGSGSVTLTVPAHCRAGVDGSRTFTVDLGPSQATDEMAGASSSTAYGRTVDVTLAPLR